MTAHSSLDHLIRESYGSEEAKRWAGSAVSGPDLERAGEAGLMVLRKSKPIAGACTYMSAMWTAMLRDALKLPAYCVAGDLRVRGRMAFGSSNPDVARSFGQSSPGWDGHCWLVLGPYIGDASLFRTAYASPEASNLRQTVVAQFGLGRGLFVMRDSDATKVGFEYLPKYVLPEDTITGLIKGAVAQGLM